MFAAGAEMVNQLNFTDSFTTSVRFPLVTGVPCLPRAGLPRAGLPRAGLPRAGLPSFAQFSGEEAKLRSV